MVSKNLKIMFLYPNLHMSTLVPNGIAILVAWLKREGFKNIDLFETTFYESRDKSKDQDRADVGQVQPFNYADRGVKLKTTDMYEDFVKKVDEFKPDIIMASILEDTFKIFINLFQPYLI